MAQPGPWHSVASGCQAGGDMGGCSCLTRTGGTGVPLPPPYHEGLG